MGYSFLEGKDGAGHHIFASVDHENVRNALESFKSIKGAKSGEQLANSGVEMQEHGYIVQPVAVAATNEYAPAAACMHVDFSNAISVAVF